MSVSSVAGPGHSSASGDTGAGWDQSGTQPGDPVLLSAWSQLCASQCEAVLHDTLLGSVSDKQYQNVMSW